MTAIEIKDQFKNKIQKAVRAIELGQIDSEKFRKLLDQALIWIEKAERGEYDNKE